MQSGDYIAFREYAFLKNIAKRKFCNRHFIKHLACIPNYHIQWPETNTDTFDLTNNFISNHTLILNLIVTRELKEDDRR